MLDGTAAATSYANHFIGVTDDQGNVYTGLWCAQKSGTDYLQMIQLRKISSGISYIKLPKFAGYIKSITISATNASATASTGDGAKTCLYIIKGTNYTSEEANTVANQLFAIGNSSTTQKTYTFDFTTKSDLYNGDGLYICSKDNAIRIWSIVVVTDGTKNPSAASAAVEQYSITATINSNGNCTCTPSSTAITTSGAVTSSSSDLLEGYSYGLKFESKSGAIVIDLPDGAINAKVSLISKVADYVKVDGVANSVQWSALTVGYSGVLGITGDCTIAKGGNDPKIQRITLTYDIPSTTQLSISTTDNMDGWRTFYDASQDYEVDANTKIYVAAWSETANKVTLTKVDKTKIPQGEAVILKTSADDHKMVLTKTTGAVSLGANVLTVTDGTNPVDGYRMGYGDIGGEYKVGFFKYYTTTAPEAGIVYIDNANVNTGSDSRGLSISFDDDETTGITTVEKTDNTDNAAQKVYNLNGQRIMNPTKGLYIVNGKKVIIK